MFRDPREVREQNRNICPIRFSYQVLSCNTPIVLVVLPPKGKDSLQETDKADAKKQKFMKQMRDATTFTDMAKHLEEMILWCKSEHMGKEKRFLSFLRLKCQKLKSLEAAGYK